jgi:hypothetical protein
MLLPDGGLADGGPSDGGRTAQRDAGTAVDSGTPDAGRVEDAGTPIGGGCMNDSDCASGDCATVGAPGGYCTLDCTNASCPAGTTCTEIDGAQLCLQDCASQHECRQGYACQPNQGVCTPPCQNNNQCGNNLRCDTGTGQCVVPCQTNSDCPAGQACDPNSGECEPVAAGCSTNADCPADHKCQSGTCVAKSTTCQTTANCPAGETCDTSTGKCGGQVGDICAQDTDCTSGTMAVCLTPGDDFPGGYCTASCTAIGGQNGCPDGYHCVVGILDGNQNQLTCMSVCQSPVDCRYDYQCVPVHNANVCVPPCNVDPSACGINQACDMRTGVCQGGGVTNGLNLDAGM